MKTTPITLGKLKNIVDKAYDEYGEMAVVRAGTGNLTGFSLLDDGTLKGIQFVDMRYMTQPD